MKKIAVLSIMIKDKSSVEAVNKLLHEAGDDILGRMGLPIKAHDLSIISIVIETCEEHLNALVESLDKLPGVQVKFVKE